MNGFKLQTSSIGSDRSTNWATTTALLGNCLRYYVFDAEEASMATMFVLFRLNKF